MGGASQELFAVNSRTHHLLAQAPLDRELQPVHHLIVQVLSFD